MPAQFEEDIVLSPEDDRLQQEVNPVVKELPGEARRPPMQVVWRNVFWMSYMHGMALYGAYCTLTARPATLLFAGALYLMTMLGVTAGTHRLWSHRSYRATLPLRVLLAAWQSMAFQNSIIEWCRDHRVHHKFSETDADPHNAKRGFFFSHMGWLLVRKHPDVRERGRALDVNDLHADPVCAAQMRFYPVCVVVMAFLLPTVIPVYVWGEGVLTALCVCGVMRLVLTLHATWLVNSAAHMWGNHPYDKDINPTESFFVSFSAVGEGYHNYHHTFPYDYSTSEFGWKVNITTLFIDAMAKLGLAYQRKKMSPEAVLRRKEKTGDGTSGFGYFQEGKKNS